MTLDTDESGNNEAPELDEEVTIFTDDDEDEIIILEDADEALFEDEGSDDDDESTDNGPVPYDRFEKKVKIAKEWETKAKTAEDALEAFKKEADNTVDPFQHYKDAGIDNPAEISKRDMQLVSTLALVAEKDPQVKAILENVIKQSNLGGKLNMDKKEEPTKPEAKVEDARVTGMLKADVQRQTEAIVSTWATAPKKIALREVINHLDLTKPVSAEDITTSLKAVLKDYGFTKADIFGSPGNKKRSKPPTAGKKASLTPAAKSSDNEDEATALKKMTGAQLSKHLRDRMRSFIVEADEEEF